MSMIAKSKKATAIMGLLVVSIVAFSGVANASDSPTGFYYGADDGGPGPSGTSPVYSMPTCGGAYGVYVARMDTVPDPYGNTAYSNAANEDAALGRGYGSMGAWDLEGPGDDPKYNGTTTEAYDYGLQQGASALTEWKAFYAQSGVKPPAQAGIMMADVEQGNGGYGTSSTYQSLDRSVFNGFYNYLTSQNPVLYAGIYTTPDFWNSDFGGTFASQHVIEWTPVTSQSSPSSSACAQGWTTPLGTSAQFYAGYTSSTTCALMWQFVSGSEDYDQMYVTRTTENIGSNCL